MVYSDLLFPVVFLAQLYPADKADFRLGLELCMEVQAE